MKSKQLLSVFIDFLIMTFLSGMIFAVFSLAQFILFPENSESGTITIKTESMPKEFSSDISVGDPLFDTLTKRRVGKIESLEKEDSGNDVFFIITSNASFLPKSDSLRTGKLWFRYTLIEGNAEAEDQESTAP